MNNYFHENDICVIVDDLTNIPDNVTHLTFSEDFNHPLTNGVIPNSVTHLTVGYKYLHSLNDCLKQPNNILQINTPNKSIIKDIKTIKLFNNVYIELNKKYIINIYDYIIDNYAYNAYTDYTYIIEHMKKIAEIKYIPDFGSEYFATKQKFEKRIIKN